MVRRKREQSAGLPVPRHLWVDMVYPDPLEWRRQRFAWARQYDWPPGKIGFLAFFMETREAYLTALGRL